MLSERTWKIDSVLRLGMGIVLSLCVGGLLAGLVRGNVDPNAPPTVMRIVISALTFQGAVLALTWKFLRENDSNWANGFGLSRNVALALGWGALAMLLVLPLCWGLQSASIALMKWVGWQPTEQLALTALRNSGTTAQLVVMGLVTVLLAPVAEEVLFRGVIYPAVRQYGFRRLAAWGSSIFFAAIHMNLAVFPSLVLLAMVLVWLYEKTDNLLAPIAAHVVFNGVNFVLFLAMGDVEKRLSF